jgi:arginyl-tRNA synthetase
MPANPHADLRAALREAVVSLGAETQQEAGLERPKRSDQGDYSTNAAMLAAPSLGSSPRDIGERLGGALEEILADKVDRIEVAGPGFVNLFMSERWHREAAWGIQAEDSFGSNPPVAPDVLLEFVSANPTGPLTAAGGRGAAYGDSLARVLEGAGHNVTREYYVNDAGTQIRNFGASIGARMRGEEPPKDGYAGEYISELADELRTAGVDAGDADGLARSGAEAMRERIEASLERFGVRFDTWSSEQALHDAGALESTLAFLAEEGHSYESEGALWLRTTAWGDDKDRVLVRSDGEPTYFAADIAYHRDKLERGGGHLIVPLGADHHGYVLRMKAAVGMLSGDPERYEAPIMQLVNIVERGERARMSKRKGEFVTLDELVDDIGVDAARFFLLQRSNDTVIDLDLDLARSTSQDNPVYYVQYAHARLSGILRKSDEEPSRGADIGVEPSEAALIRRLLEFPDEVVQAAEKRAPHRICAYATAVAADFHAFYRDCRVVGADEELEVEGIEAARLTVCRAAQRVIAASLELLGVSAPERM